MLLFHVLAVPGSLKKGFLGQLLLAAWGRTHSRVGNVPVAGDDDWRGCGVGI